MSDVDEKENGTAPPVTDRIKHWFVSSDKEWSKRMTGRVEKVFYLHTLLTLVVETTLAFCGMVVGQATSILLSCIPVYSAVLLGMLAKSGVENVYKGKTEMTSIETGKATTKPINLKPPKPVEETSNG